MIVLCLSACRARTAIEAREVSFESADGAALHATLHVPSIERPPALLLLHMFGSDRHAWDRFAGAAAARGYLVLAIDIRGISDADRTAALSSGKISDAATDRILDDIGRGIQYLLDSGADPANLVVGGASIGANFALKYAARDQRVVAAILLSPGEDYRGVTVLPELETYQRRPLLVVATEGDTYSSSTAKKLKSEAQTYCELRVYRGSSHGTDILDAIDVATGQILVWLDPIVHGESSQQ